MQAIVTVPPGTGKPKLVLLFRRADDLFTDSAASSVAATSPYIRGESGGQLAGTNTFLCECQNLREFHQAHPRGIQCPMQTILTRGCRVSRSINTPMTYRCPRGLRSLLRHRRPALHSARREYI